MPVLYARSGLNLVDGGEEAGRKAYADYTANRYHKPADEYDPAWDFRGVIEDLEAFRAVGQKLADEATFPEWKPDADFHRPAALPQSRKANKNRGVITTPRKIAVLEGRPILGANTASGARRSCAWLVSPIETMRGLHSFRRLAALR